MIILGADIGGTKTCLSLIEFDTARIAPKEIQKKYYESQKYPQFQLLLQHFLGQCPSIDAACFALAGPIETTNNNQTCAMTNLAWKLDKVTISQQFGINKLMLINDFEAVAYGINSLHKEQLIELQAGTPVAKSRRAVIGAGTGLGQAFMIWHHNTYHIYSTEGGHVDFAATNPLERELVDFLSPNESRISYEHLLSGDGLSKIYAFLHKKSGSAQDPIRHSAAQISQLAHANSDSLAGQCLQLFVRIYGSQASNVALTTLPKDGIYIAGGIAAKNQMFFSNGEFIKAFLNKPKMQQLLKSIPVKLIMNPEVGLLGALKQAEILGRKSIF